MFLRLPESLVAILGWLICSFIYSENISWEPGTELGALGFQTASGGGKMQRDHCQEKQWVWEKLCAKEVVWAGEGEGSSVCSGRARTDHSGEVMFDTGIFLMMKRWRFKAILNKVNLMEIRERDLGLHLSFFSLIWKFTGVIKLFIPAASQGMKIKHRTILRPPTPTPLAGVYSVQILLELDFVKEQKDTCTVSERAIDRYHEQRST